MGLPITCLLLVALLCPASADQVLGTYNLLLDPGRILAWQTKWLAGQIALSQTNQGAKNVTISFYINPSSTVIGGVFEVLFPTGFDLSVLARSGSAISVAGQTVQVAASVNSGVDTTISIPYIGLPVQAGPYGPFAVKTRALTTGQVVDMNSVFGEVYITGPATRMDTMAVTYSPIASSNIINKRNNTLSFKFTVTEELWAYDYIRIAVASQFSLFTPICRSVSYGSQLNTLNGTYASNPGQLACLVTSTSGSQVLWVYGLQQDFPLDPQTNTAVVSLEVTGFTNPDRDYPASAYIWTIETIRFNTRNTLNIGMCSGPETDHDWIYAATWVPTWGRPVTNILREQTIFMDITFTIVNPIPAGGSITVETSTDSVAWGSSKNNRCYVVTLLSTTVTCTQTAGITTITGLTALSAGTSVTLRTLSKFTTLYNAYREEIKFITTRSSEGYWIDRGESLAGFNLPQTNKAYNAELSVLLQKVDGTSAQLAGGTGDATQYVKFMVGGMQYLTYDINNYRIAPGSSVTLTCPIYPQSDDNNFYFPTTNRVTQYKSSGTTYDFTTGTTSFLTSGYSSQFGSPLTISTGSITKNISGKTIYTPGSIQFTAGTDHQVSQFTVGISVLSVSGLPQVINSVAIGLPRIVSNAASVYECALDIIDPTGGLVPVRATAQFNIDPQPFSSRGFTYFCASGQFAGAPVRVSFLPKVLDLYPNTSTRTYYLDLIFSSSHYSTYIPGVSTFHGSGAIEGDTYPMESSLSLTPTMIVTTDGQSSTFVHRITGLGDISPQSPAVDIFFPVGVAKVTKPTLSFRTFYTLLEDPRLRYQSHGDSLLSTEQYTVDTTTASDGAAFTSPSINDATAIGGDSGTLTIQLSLALKITGDSYFYVVLPKGFTFQTTRSVTPTSQTSESFPFVKYFSAPNLKFAFPGLLVKAYASGYNIGSSSTTVEINGVVYPIGAITGAAITVVHAHTGSLLGQACAYSYKKTDFSTNSGTITGVAVFPNSVVARGPMGVDVTETVSFTLSHGIDLGGWIYIRLNAAWGVYDDYTSCSVVGLDQAVLGTPVSCTVSSGNFIIRGFAGFVGINRRYVSVRIDHLAAPANTGDNEEFFAELSSYPSWVTTAVTTTAIDTYKDLSTGSSTSKMKVTAALTVPVVKYEKIRIFPSNAGVSDSDLYLRLRFGYRLPPRTNLYVTFPTQYIASNPTNCTQVADICFSYNILFRTCGCYFSASGTKIGLTLTLNEELRANATLELYFDHAINPPASVYTATGTSADGFYTRAVWYNTIISDDGSTYRSEQLVVPDAQLTGGINPVGTTPLLADPTTSYESSKYTFSFSLSTALNTADTIYIIFPDDYDPFIGNSEQWFETEVGNFYLPCASQQLQTVLCRADHRLVIVQGSVVVNALTTIVLEISGVRNPKQGQTGNFKILHENAAGTITEIASSFGSLTITSLPLDLTIKTIDVTSRTIGSVGDYSLTLYMTDTFLSNTELKVNFPKEMDLMYVDQKTNYPCLTSWIDHSPGSLLQGSQDWNNHRTCAAKNNTLTLSPPSQSISFNRNSEVSLLIRGVMTPQWGQVRSPKQADMDFDAWDWNVWTVWSYWSSQFKVFVYQKDLKRVTSRAYSSMNAGYLGFMQPLRTISINGYNPQNRANRIVVYPGTQTSDIPITLVNISMPLQAKNLQFQPTISKRTPDNNLLTFTSYQDNWLMVQDEWTIHFRVSADKTLTKGLYYVNWKVDEGRQPGVEHPVYDLPPVTLLEVAELTVGVVPFQIAAILPLAIGFSQAPVKVALANPPDKDVTLHIQLDSNLTTVLISPSSLTFYPNLDYQYFNITVLPTHDYLLYPTQTLLFSISGTNAEAYSVVSSIEFSITENYFKTYGEIAQMGVSSVTRTSFAMKPVTDQAGIVYYAVSAKGTKVIPFEDMKASYMTFNVSQLLMETRHSQFIGSRYQAAADTDPPPDLSWNDFQHQLYSQHMSSFLATGVVIQTTVELDRDIVIDGLWAGSEYQVVGYFDNLDPTSPGSSVTIEYVTTTPVADCSGVSLIYSGIVGQNQQTRVQQVLAKALGVNPARLQSPLYQSIASRDLQKISGVLTNNTGTEFQYYLVANRKLDAPEPGSLTALTPQQINDLADDMKDSLGLELVSYSVLPARTRTQPLWMRQAEVLRVSNTSITTTYESNTAGRACCVALNDAEFSISLDQVQEGYNYNWTKVPSKCAATEASIVGEMDITGVEPDGVYFVFCSLMDDYPLWSTQMSYSVAQTVPFIPVHTPVALAVEVELYALGVVLVLGLLWTF